MKDIRPVGAAEGKGAYWVKVASWLAGGVGSLHLVVIDEYGDIHGTPMRAVWDNSAPTRAEALEAHLAGLVKDADRDLERRGREGPEQNRSLRRWTPPRGSF